MDQDKTDPAQRPQTLLEAANAMFSRVIATAVQWDNLRAAIAREEATPSSSHQDLVWKARAERAEYRAQHAESAYADRDRQYCTLRTESARWQARAEAAESDLANMGQQLSLLCERRANPPVVVAQPFEGDPQTCAFGLNAFRGNREAAESDDDDDEDDPVDPTTGFTFATYRRLLEALGGKS